MRPLRWFGVLFLILILAAAACAPGAAPTAAPTGPAAPASPTAAPDSDPCGSRLCARSGSYCRADRARCAGQPDRGTGDPRGRGPDSNRRPLQPHRRDGFH